MRHGRLFITMLAALAVMAIGPAYAAAATSSLADDSAADFGLGTLGHGTTVAGPGSVQLTTVEPFDGSALPNGYAIEQMFDPTGTATVAGGQLAVNAAIVRGVRDLTPAPVQVLEFKGTFGADANQHVGLAGPGPLSTGPWAMFSTESGGGLWARTRVGSDPEVDVRLDGIVIPTQPHTYRIEWSANAVSYFIDGAPVATHTATIAGPMQAVVSEGTPGGDAVSVDWLDLGAFPSSGTFESRVLDTGDATSTFGALNAAVTTPASAAVTFKTRSGPNATPGSGWSDWTDVANGAAVISPANRFIQYQATLSPDAATNQTPSVDRVSIGYTVTDPPPSGGTGTGGGAGGGASGGASGGTGGGTGTTQQSGTGSSTTAADKTKPKVSVVAKSLKASKKGAVSFTVGCPATEQSCKITLKLKNGKKIAASKTVNVKGGKSKTVTLTLDKATRKLLAKRHTLKVSTVVTAVDAAGNKRTTTKQATLRRAAG